jgi:HAD superfamily hydrolase (TIGR01459 family)
MNVRLLSGIAAIAADYDGYILDLWGVLHDGAHPMPGALEALHRLQAMKKHVVILSNAPRRAEAVVARIAEIGIARDLYDELLSSGEATWRWLKQGGPGGRRLYPIMAERDASMLDGLDFEISDSIEKADFILNTGVESANDKVEDFEDALREAAFRHLPMVCANPDLVVMHRGKMEICAGSIAQYYEELGAKVQYFGKPHAPIYRDCFSLLKVTDRKRILAVGDSLRTDIAGANAAGIDGLLVLGGIHQEELTGGDLNSVIERAGVIPTAAVPVFCW